jgi:Domain of unknown function (DUF4411)
VLYLLDADTVIRADSTYYPLKRFPVFWQWLRHNGSAGIIKIPMEQFEEIVAGTGALVDWLEDQANGEALLFAEEADPDLVAAVTADGYAPDLNEAELVAVGLPFLSRMALPRLRSAALCLSKLQLQARYGQTERCRMFAQVWE